MRCFSQKQQKFSYSPIFLTKSCGGMGLKSVLSALAMTILSLSALAENEEEIILRVTGAARVEDVDQQEWDRLVQILHDPIEINRSGRDELLSSGLFTSFQIASLQDYILRHGPVMSFTELSLVDGFSSNCVECLRAFLSLATHDAGALPPAARGLKGECSARSAFKHDKEKSGRWEYAMRGRLSTDAISLSFSCSREYDAQNFWPSLYSANLLWRHRSGTLIAGDFNARFGQGLCLWNTATFSSLSSPSYFMKRSSGLSPTFSFKGSTAYTGLAGDIASGRWKVSFMLHSPDLKKTGHPGWSFNLQPAVNLTRYFDCGHAGITHVASFSDVVSADFRIPVMKTSSDFAFCLSGVNIFGEVLYDWIAAKTCFLTGLEAAVGENVCMASQIRYLPLSDEYGTSLSGELTCRNHHAVFSADLLYHPSGKSLTQTKAIQCKFQATWKWKICDMLDSQVRLNERIRTWGCRYRTDARLDLALDLEPWTINSRLNILNSRDWGYLAYLEGSYSIGKALKAYLRQGIFFVDEWDDRIYVYERDAPGNFNVPAFYGRGVWTSGYLTWRFHKSGNLCFRASYVSYILMSPGAKDDRLELKIQLSLHF